MLDLILGWIVIVFPFAFSIAVLFMPSQQENKGRHMKWRTAVVVIGIIFSLTTWWQQSRSAKAFDLQRQQAIQQTAEKTAESVTRTISKLYESLIGNLNQQIGSLQRELAKQGKDVTTIKQSNIVTGKNPVKVEVMNQSSVVQSKEVKSPEINVNNVSLEKNEREHVQIIKLAIQNSGETGTSAHISVKPLFNKTALPPLLMDIPDRIEFGPHQGFTILVSLGAEQFDALIAPPSVFALQLDVDYSVDDRNNLSRHYRYIGKYDLLSKLFIVIESGPISSTK
jgi:hypothetical protein